MFHTRRGINIKLISALLIAILAFSSCGKAKTPDPTDHSQTSVQTSTPIPLTSVTVAATTKPNQSTDRTVDYFLAEFGKNLTIGDIQSKAAEMIGAIDGKSFTVNGKSYEMYEYESQASLSEAKKDGSFLSSILKDTKVEMVENGLIVMICPKGDTTLLDAFKNVK